MKILLVQTSYLGDVLLSTPVIGGIKEIYPEAKLWVMVRPEALPVVKNDPLVEEVIVFDKRKNKSGLLGLLAQKKLIEQYQFDKVYSLHQSARTAILLWLSGIRERVGFSRASWSFLYTTKIVKNACDHAVKRFLTILSDKVKIEELSSELRLFLPPKEELREDIQMILSKQPSYAVLVPGSEWETKRWMLDGYREVASNLSERGFKILLCGSEKERSYCNSVRWDGNVENIVGETDIGEFIWLIAGASLVVCNDSFALHVASALKVKNIAVFCATSPNQGFGPWKNKFAEVVEKKGLYCKPCRRHGGRFCPTGTEKCMRELPVREVVNAIGRVLSM